MTSQEFERIVRESVAEYTNEYTDKTDAVEPVKAEDVYIVWQCKTLQNHKALAATPRPDGMYYELTYNGDRNELYVDAYKKFDNRCVKC